MTLWYTIEQACIWTEFTLTWNPGWGWSDTTIRCTINDALDRAEKTGCRVCHGYSQKKACRRVRYLHRLRVLNSIHNSVPGSVYDSACSK